MREDAPDGVPDTEIAGLGAAKGSPPTLSVG